RAGAPILPREIAVPALPGGIAGGGEAAGPHQRQIADRDGAGVALAAVEIGEGIELLDIAEGEAGLARHPVAQAELEGAVAGDEGAGGQGLAAADREHARLVLGDRHDHGAEIDRNLALLGRRTRRHPILGGCLNPNKSNYIGGAAGCPRIQLTGPRPWIYSALPGTAPGPPTSYFVQSRAE